MSKYLRCYQDFSGGLSEAANDNMKDNQLVRAMNIIPGEGAGLARTFGSTPILPQLPEISGAMNRLAALIPLTLADGSTLTLAFRQSQWDEHNLYRLNSDKKGWTLLAENQPLLLDWFVHSHKLFWLDGQKLRYYDGSVVATAGITPAGSSPTQAENAVWAKVERAVAVEQRGQRWFYATRNNELIFSNIGSPTSISPTSVINVNTKNDDQITALREFNNGLLVFKQHSVHYLSGWDLAGGSDISLYQLNVTCGAKWPKTVRTVENGVLYLGENGLYRLYVPNNSLVVAAENISEHHIAEALLRQGEIRDAYAEVWDNIYFLSVYGGPAMPWTIREYRYYPQLGAFFGEYTQAPTCYSLYQGRLCFGIDHGHVLAYDKDSRHYIGADGQPLPIEILAVTKGFDVAGTMAQDIKLKSVLVMCRQFKAESSHITLRVKADYSDSQYRLDLLNLDESLIYGEGDFATAYWGWKDTVFKELPVQRKAKRIWFFLSDDHCDEPALVYGLGLLYRKRKPRGSTEGITRTTVIYDD